MDTRNAVIESIIANVPELREVLPHGGVFTEESMRVFAQLAPAARVAFLDTNNVRLIDTGEMVGDAEFACYLVAEDDPPFESHDVALMLAEKVAAHINGRDHDAVYGGIALVKQIKSLASVRSEVSGVTLFAITYVQQIRFGTDFTLSEETVYAPSISQFVGATGDEEMEFDP